MERGMFTSHAICSECGWSDVRWKAKHRTHRELQERKVTNSKGLIIDSYLLNVQRRNGVLDLCWCPKCDSFIELYYNAERQE